ncbi:MAG: UDP-N-acetylmuramyl-tripeptide synthetase [Candidatus Levybacteria bacterium]|nr:UDP-N-acetylmuramyl-tripeptide synthetase [Candidatus Levybacteria bacterium]
MLQRIKNIYHLGNGILGNLRFGFPSHKLTVIGVTGTDGKTTTTSLIYHVLSTSGRNASMISSVGAVIGGREYDVGFHVTTPSSWALQKFIKEAEKGFLVLETTSHALDQFRVWGIKFDIGVLTNITHEHLDYHKTYHKYVEAKAKLLEMSRVAIVNRDDKSYPLINSKFARLAAKREIRNSKLITYGMKDNADLNPKKFPFKTNMIGEFNIYNSLAAIAVCRALGIPDEDIRTGLKSFKPPIGREEVVYKKDFTVMIDFAHTPNAFEEILSSIKPSIKGRLIHVFGSAGLRDNTKRPIMGRVSSKYADIIVLTSEDPRSESVEKISDEIESGIKIPNSKSQITNKSKIQIYKIPNRQEAIQFAIKIARKGDLVLTTGKSHEKSMNYGHGEVPWDEYSAVRKALKGLGLKIKD